ncbi:MAG: histidine phosphotransferase family protein [Alphaproteobacteria bacterium]|nr:histidine phosphotransferase family protein [Alphaproteobacteria bacterium]
MTNGFTPEIAELLTSRLCHELVGPIGAVSNGVEFAEEVADGASDAIGLIADSARRAAARLQFYRLAYGRAGRTVGGVPALRDAAADFVAGEKAVLTWPEPVGAALVERAGGGKLLLVSIEILMGALMRGGSISLDPAGADGAGVIVTAAGDRAALPDEVLATLRDGGNSAPSPRTIHCVYAHILRQECGVSLTVESVEGSLTLTLTA